MPGLATPTWAVAEFVLAPLVLNLHRSGGLAGQLERCDRVDLLRLHIEQRRRLAVKEHFHARQLPRNAAVRGGLVRHSALGSQADPREADEFAGRYRSLAEERSSIQNIRRETGRRHIAGASEAQVRQNRLPGRVVRC